MTDGDAIRAAVLTHPGEDTPRLLYADWLQEQASAVTCHICGGKGGWDSQYHGRGYAPHWCRCATCEGTGLEPDAVGSRAKGMRWMLSSPKNSWVCLCNYSTRPCNVCVSMGDEVADIPRRTDGETHYVVNRGFVSEVRCTGESWVAHGPRLVTRHPLERVVLLGAEPLQLGHGPHIGEWFFTLRDVPPELHDLLQSRRGPFSNHFATRHAAMILLSEACLSWAHRVATAI